MKKHILLAVFILLALPCAAGPYGISICSVPERARRPWPDTEAMSPSQVAVAIALYARGGAPSGMFVAAFTNARVTFCSPADRRAVLESLVVAIPSAIPARLPHLTQFLGMLGPTTAIAIVDSHIQDSSLSESSRARLSQSRAALTRWQRLRSHSKPAA
jgi:hypothetical protein